MATRSDPGVVQFLTRFVSFCSVLSSGFGLLVLTGWALHIQVLKTTLPGQVAVKANTGFCFVLLGLALWVLRKEDARWHRGLRLAAKVLALFAAVVGVLSFLECWYGWDLGIDQLLFTAGPEDAPGSVRIGLMSPFSGVGFCLLGSALALLDLRSRWGQRLAQGLASVAAVTSIFGILDFVLDPSTTHTHIAPTTALLLLLLSFGVMFSRTGSELGALLASASPGGELVRRLLPAAIVVPIIIGWLRWKGQFAGLYGDWTGVALMTVLTVSLLACFTIWTGTILQRTAAKQRESEESLRLLASIVTSSQDAIIGKTLGGIVMSWNPGAEAIYGYSAREMIGHPISVLIPPDRIDEFQTIMLQVARGEGLRQYETTRLHKDGHTFHVALAVSPVKDENGKIVAASTISRDISAVKKAQEQLREASLYARTLLEASLDPLVTISREGKITDVNEATEKVTGVARDRLIGSDFSDYFTQPDKARWGYEEVFANGVVRDYPLAIRHASGRVTDVLYNASVFKSQRGEIGGVFAAARDITERKRAEEELRLGRERLALAQKAAHSGTFEWDIQNNVNRWTPELEEVYGLEPGTFGGKYEDWERMVLPEDLPAAKAAIEASLTTGEFASEWRIRRAHDGEVRYVTARAKVIFDKAGRPSRMIGLNMDITERRQTEEALRASSERLALAMKAAQSGSFDWDIRNNVDTWSTEKEALYGLAPGQFSGTHQDWEAFVIAEDLPGVKATIQQAFKTGEFASEFRIRRRDNSEVRWMNVRAKVAFDEGGLPTRMVGINIDITERKRAEEKAREASMYSRSLLEASLDPLVTISREGKITDVNQATEKVTGVSRDHLIGSDFSNYFTEPDKARSGYLEVFAEGFVHDYPLAIRHTSGQITDVLYNASVFKNEQGEVGGVFAAARDITKRKRAEEEVLKLNRELEERVQQRTAQLQESEQRVRRKLDIILSPEGDLGKLDLADLMDLAGVQALAEDFYRLTQIPMFILDLKGTPLVSVGWQEICTKFHRVHPEACKNCQESDRELSQGVAPGQFKLYKCKNSMWDVVTPITVGGQHVGNLFSGQFFFDDEQPDFAVFRSQASQYGFDAADYLAALDHAPRLSRAAVDTGMAFFIKFSQVLSQVSYSSVKLARSAEETRRINAELAASVKELEAFTYSVSHDLRAPLRHISGFSKILTEEFASSLPEEAHHHLRRIEEGTQRMGQLVDDLLNLARVGRRDLSLQVAGLAAIVEEVISSLTPDLAGRQVQWKIGALPFVECDPGLMKQVFQNLLSNAVKFTRPRAQAVIEVGLEQHDGALSIYVRDNGVGFSMKYADKLFGVFQRLHRAEDFEGTGVGLATVQRIIHKHGGRIWAEAELDKGATFYFELGNSEKNERKDNSLTVGDTYA